MLNNNIAATLILVIIIILSSTLLATSQQSAGLLVATIVGFITVVAAIPSFFGLPQLPTKPYPTTHQWFTALVQAFLPFKELIKKPNILLMLLAYTVYTATTFARGLSIGQLYYAEIQPGTLEVSLYSLATYISFIICTITFCLGHRQWNFSLEKCFLLGYAIVLIVPLWGCIGVAKQD
jgi:MFS-type transporter involved in bile tolerance (Atg22 family)